MVLLPAPHRPTRSCHPPCLWGGGCTLIQAKTHQKSSLVLIHFWEHFGGQMAPEMSSKMLKKLLKKLYCFCIAFLTTSGDIWPLKMELFVRHFGSKTCIFQKVQTLSIYCACQYLLRFGTFKKGTFLNKNLDFLYSSKNTRFLTKIAPKKLHFGRPNVTKSGHKHDTKKT